MSACRAAWLVGPSARSNPRSTEGPRIAGDPPGRPQLGRAPPPTLRRDRQRFRPPREPPPIRAARGGPPGRGRVHVEGRSPTDCPASHQVPGNASAFDLLTGFATRRDRLIEHACRCARGIAGSSNPRAGRLQLDSSAVPAYRERRLAAGCRSRYPEPLTRGPAWAPARRFARSDEELPPRRGACVRADPDASAEVLLPVRGEPERDSADRDAPAHSAGPRSARTRSGPSSIRVARTTELAPSARPASRARRRDGLTARDGRPRSSARLSAATGRTRWPSRGPPPRLDAALEPEDRDVPARPATGRPEPARGAEPRVSPPRSEPLEGRGARPELERPELARPVVERPDSEFDRPERSRGVVMPELPSLCHANCRNYNEGRSANRTTLVVSCVRRRPTLPRSGPRSTIGAERLSFRVRDGTGRFPLAMVAETLWRYRSRTAVNSKSGQRGPYLRNRTVDA